MNYAEVYAKFATLPDAKKIFRDSEGFTENMWVKLHESLFIINNFALNPQYRFQDVVDDSGTIVHRRWKTRVDFLYDADRVRYQELIDALSPLGDVNLLTPSRGALLSEVVLTTDIEALRAKMLKTLSDLDMLGAGENSVQPLDMILDVDLARFQSPSR